MLQQSNTKIIAADYSKFNRSAFAKIAGIEVADYIVTNKEIDTKTKTAFSKQNVVIM